MNFKKPTIEKPTLPEEIPSKGDLLLKFAELKREMREYSQRIRGGEATEEAAKRGMELGKEFNETSSKLAELYQFGKMQSGPFFKKLEELTEIRKEINEYDQRITERFTEGKSTEKDAKRVVKLGNKFNKLSGELAEFGFGRMQSQAYFSKERTEK